jgi:hypothetical protein
MHTKGKWEWSEINQLLSGNDCILILIYDAEYDFWRIHISEDNKRLIAAAPEMLELMEEFIKYEKQFFIPFMGECMICSGGFHIENNSVLIDHLDSCIFKKAKSLLSKIKGGE